MNIESADLIEVKKKTQHVLGIEGVPGSSGDPSPVTARGVFGALRATASELNSDESLKGIKVAIQGLGHVGYTLAELIKDAGGQLWVTDVDGEVVQKAKKELGANPVSMEEIYSVDCDIFSPCAVGGTLNKENIEKFKCKAVVGCANNQLDTEDDGYRLHEKGILYAPDFVVNSGGIINVFIEHKGYDEAKALNMADGIYDTTKEILSRSRKQGELPFIIANHIAEERLYGAG